MELKEISASEIGVNTYLIGELHRRVGEIGAAETWFDRVADGTKGDPKTAVACGACNTAEDRSKRVYWS